MSVVNYMVIVYSNCIVIFVEFHLYSSVVTCRVTCMCLIGWKLLIIRLVNSFHAKFFFKKHEYISTFYDIHASTEMVQIIVIYP